ncbi:MAG: VIT1/CCC1 transporter family protein, partial [bacterium]
MDNATLRSWLHHWQDECDAAYLYLVLAGQEPDLKKKEIYVKLAGVEERHTQMWEKLLAEHGHPMTRRPRPSLNARLRAWVGRRFGPGYLLPLLLREEGQEVKGYMDLHKESRLDDAREVSLQLAKESAAHAETLASLAGQGSEPWHKTGSGGFLRNLVYGFNDGLTANFGLVAGVLGAEVSPQIVMVSGFAGMIADALSMGASGYLAAKSEQEVYAHEIAMEQEEIRLMPEVEQDELTLVYQAKGIEPGMARQLAAEVMRDPQRALGEQVREELKIGQAHATPIKEGWV